MGKDHLIYEIAQKPINLVSFEHMNNPLLNPLIIFQKSKAVEYKRISVRSIRFIHSRGLHRLVITANDKRIEIGDNLSIPEKKVAIRTVEAVENGENDVIANMNYPIIKSINQLAKR